MSKGFTLIEHERSKSVSRNEGFTLIELLVVTSIIVLMTVLVLPNYRAGDQQLELQRAASQLTQDLRRAQEMALSSKEFVGKTPYGYGIYFNQSQPGQYILFADLDGDQFFDSGDEVEIWQLSEKVQISELLPGNPLTIVFIPPDPTVVFKPDGASASITIEAEGLEAQIIQYVYQHKSTPLGRHKPRADCDVLNDFEDCPDSFPATALDIDVVYDQYEWCFGKWCFPFSKLYRKQETEVLTPLQRTIQVNKAGLIAVE